MRFIYLGHGYEAIVDDADYQAVVNAGPWSVQHNGKNVYVRRNTYVNGKRKTQMLHRFIAGESSTRIDHRNTNGLDNRRNNLRESTMIQNMANSRKRQGSSKYKGVSKRGNRWAAQLQVNYKKHHLGYFQNEIDAAAAYDIAARAYSGDFAKGNGVA